MNGWRLIFSRRRTGLEKSLSTEKVSISWFFRLFRKRMEIYHMVGQSWICATFVAVPSTRGVQLAG